MDWLRRNWPDLLIGLALVAVIAGIIATLISGGSFFPAGNRTADNPGQGATPLTGPASAGAQSNQVNSDDEAADAGLGAAGVGAADTEAVTAAGDSAAAAGGASGSANTVTATPDAAADAAVGDAAGPAAADATPSTDQSGAALPVAVLPPSGQTSDGPSAAAADSSSQEGAAPSSSVSSTAASAADAGVDSGIDIPASVNSEAPYRVSVGAYANRANAEGQAATFRDAGYPVFIGEQGNLNIVLVGPYDSESEARSVAAGIRNGDFGVADPTVYEFTGDDEDQAGAQASASSVSSSAASPSSDQAAGQPGSEAVVADDDTVIASSPAAAAGVRYLQAGAYGSRDSSLPQRDRLEGLGFVVTERVENDLVKLLIGPFDAANLENAESRLEAAGIASFPR